MRSVDSIRSPDGLSSQDLVSFSSVSTHIWSPKIPQHDAIETYAAENNHRITHWYKDEGISGSRSDREDFQRLIADAETGTFKAILCWDQDRFSRFPPLEANHYWYLLNVAGVHIATVAQGKLNFDDLGEWLKASVVQHGKAEYLKDLARNVKRGQREAASRGEWLGGPVPRQAADFWLSRRC